jgi:plastocyanin
MRIISFPFSNNKQKGGSKMLSLKRFSFCLGLAFLWIMLFVQVGVGAVHHVSIVNFEFVPTTDTIAFGDSVTWTNNAVSTPHTSTSDASIWDSGTLNPGHSFSFHFTSNGTFPYHCNIHPDMHGTIVVISSEVKDETGNRDNPTGFDLSQNYPNPFNQSTKIDFVLKASGFTTLTVYDLLGRRVRTLVDANLSAGYKSVLWDGKGDSGNDVSSGIYFYRIKVASSPSDENGNYTETRKLLLLK